MYVCTYFLLYCEHLLYMKYVHICVYVCMYVYDVSTFSTFVHAFTPMYSVHVCSTLNVRTYWYIRHTHMLVEYTNVFLLEGHVLS